MISAENWMNEKQTLRLKYLLKSERLKTFIKWPFSDDSNCSAEKMAEAGFYMPDVKQYDLAVCFVCNKELDGWEESDDPWKEHKKHSSNCCLSRKGWKYSELTESQTETIIQTLLQECLEEFVKSLSDKRSESFARKFEKNKKTVKKRIAN